MRGKKAKALRRKVYGEHSPRVREYVSKTYHVPVKDKPGYSVTTETKIATGLRRVYQDTKGHA